MRIHEFLLLIFYIHSVLVLYNILVQLFKLLQFVHEILINSKFHSGCNVTKPEGIKGV